MISKRDAADFPFLGSAYVKSLNLDSFGDDDIKNVDEYLTQVYTVERPTVFFENLDTETSIKRFLGCCIILNQARKSRMIAKFAEFEANKYIHMLKLIYDRDKTHKKEEFFVYYNLIFTEIYRVKNFVQKIKSFYAVRLVQYFRLVELSRKEDDPLALINQLVLNGYVMFSLENLFEAMRRKMKTYITTRINDRMFKYPTIYEVENRGVKPLKFHEPIPIPERIMKLIKKYEIIDIADSIIKSKGSGKNPPCISFLLDKISSKHELGHQERLFLALFLKKRGYTDEQILGIYKDLNNFDEHTTRYHLESLDNYEHIHSCKKVRDLGMCRPDNRCRVISHPDSY